MKQVTYLLNVFGEYSPIDIIHLFIIRAISLLLIVILSLGLLSFHLTLDSGYPVKDGPCTEDLILLVEQLQDQVKTVLYDGVLGTVVSQHEDHVSLLFFRCHKELEQFQEGLEDIPNDGQL